MNDLISVVVPVYNAANYLERCVKSICEQTYQLLEIILVDDGSVDGSGELCDRFAKSDDRITVIHQKNAGSTAARNAGISLANGMLIGFVDSDDYIERNMYEELINILLEKNADIAVCRQYIDKNGISYVEKERSIVTGVLEKQKDPIEDHIIFTNDMANKGISPNLWDKLFKKELIERHQFNICLDTKFAEDDLCVYACLLDAEKIAFVNKPLYHYCKREGSVTQNGDVSYFEKINLFYSQMKEVFMQHDKSEVLLRKLNHYMVEHVLRGINKNFGFGYGTIVPFYLPPYKLLDKIGAKKIILYGAGDVGQSYYRAFGLNGTYEIVLWVDMRWERLNANGLNVSNPVLIRDSLYDVVLIAADNVILEEQIREYLKSEYKLDDNLILGGHPLKFLETF